MSVNLAIPLARIKESRSYTPPGRSMLVAISGIDGCGKGYITALLVKALQVAGFRAASINVDGWLNLPGKRFNPSAPAEYFYQNAIRFDELFAQLVVPLRDQRSAKVEVDFTEETATTYRKQLYSFEDIDVIVLEGIYLLKRDLRHYYDLSIWIECSFETALKRALARGQEGLPPEETIQAYRSIYFPAQEIHLRRDDPVTAADLILDNDAG